MTKKVLGVAVDIDSLTLGQLRDADPKQAAIFRSELPLFLNCYQAMTVQGFWDLSFADYRPLKEFVASLMSGGDDGENP